MDSAFYIAFSIPVLHGAVKPSVARRKADYSRADIVLYCSLQYRYSIWQTTAHTTYSVYNAIAYTLYRAPDGCNIFAITHNPEATGLSPIPATMFNRWFRKKSTGPNCTPTGIKWEWDLLVFVCAIGIMTIEVFWIYSRANRILKCPPKKLDNPSYRNIN